MKKNIFIHIGFNKTGSSYIQNCLALNSDTLASLGYYYPAKAQSSYVQNMQHVPLATAITGVSVYWLNKKKKGTIEKAKADFIGDVERSGLNDVIVSSEAFGDINVRLNEVEKVISYFKNYNIYAIAYIRRQDEYMLSAYQQDVKTGTTNNFCFEERINFEQNHFLKRLEPWRELLGQDHVLIREYDQTKWTHGDLFLDFLTAIGVPAANWEFAESINEGLDYREVSLLTQLNSFLNKNIPGKQSLPIRNHIRSTVLQTIKSIEPPPDGRQKLRFSKREIERVAEFFREENKLLLGTELGERFISIPTDEVEGNTDSVELDSELMLEVITLLAKKVVKLKRQSH